MAVSKEMKKFNRLVSKYEELKDDLLEVNDNFYDGMLYDLEGYYSLDDEEAVDYLEELENQVEAFKLILKGLKKIHYIFG